MTEQQSSELAEAKETGMYEEIEQAEHVARGHLAVIQIIMYGGPDGDAPYFCQTIEQEQIFKANNPGVRMETFHIQLLKSTAIKYLNSPRNVKQFIPKDGA